MKKVGAYFVIGLVVAFVGVLLSDVFADLFNGLPYGTGAILGMGVYLCVVVITCTGIIISKLDDKAENEKKDEQE